MVLPWRLSGEAASVGRPLVAVGIFCNNGVFARCWQSDWCDESVRVIGRDPLVARAGMEINNFQRVGATSNTHAGNDFEGAARDFFGNQGIVLTKNFSVPVGV